MSKVSQLVFSNQNGSGSSTEPGQADAITVVMVSRLNAMVVPLYDRRKPPNAGMGGLSTLSRFQSTCFVESICDIDGNDGRGVGKARIGSCSEKFCGCTWLLLFVRVAGSYCCGGRSTREEGYSLSDQLHEEEETTLNRRD